MEPANQAEFSQRWKGWDRFPQGQPFLRPELEALLTGLDKQSLALVRGPRGVGKSTLLQQVGIERIRRGQKRESILFIDLEDPVWAPRPTLEGVDALVAQLDDPVTVLLDGVERLSNWADWARDLRARSRGEVLAARSGSVARSEPAGVECIDCLPLDLSSWMKIYTDESVDIDGGRRVLGRFLQQGGLPLPMHPEEMRKNRIELLMGSLLKDVVLLRSVRDTNLLTAMSVYLMSNTGRPVSASRLKGTLTRSVDQARMFLGHLEAAGLIYLVRRLEDADRKSSQAARLCFSVDTGLAASVDRRGESEDDQPADMDGICLTAVFHQLLRERLVVHAWRARNRVGLAVGPANRPTRLIDVQTGESKDLGLTPLASAMERTGCGVGLLLIDGPIEGADPALAGPGVIETQSLWSWLLNPRLEAALSSKSTDKKVEKSQAGLPPHLL